MAQLMMQAPKDLIQRFEVPAEVVHEAYRDNPVHRASTIVSLRKVRRLARELGLINPVSRELWRRFGIWDEDVQAAKA
jgi:hypothetical protein